MSNTYHMNVKARDEQGNKVPGAWIRVRLYEDEDEGGHLREDRLLETDDEGERSWSSTILYTPNRWDITVGKAGYNEQTKCGITVWQSEGDDPDWRGTVPDQTFVLVAATPEQGGGLEG